MSGSLPIAHARYSATTLNEKCELLRAQLGYEAGTPPGDIIQRACKDLGVNLEGGSIGTQADACCAALGNVGSSGMTPTVVEATAVDSSAAIAPVPATSAAMGGRVSRYAVEEKVRLLGNVEEWEAIAYNRSLSGDEVKKTVPKGCYLCAPVCCGIKAYVGGAYWLSVFDGACICNVCNCFFGIPWPLYPSMFCFAKQRNARGSVHGWQFEGKDGADNGRLYVVDIEKNTFAFYLCEECACCKDGPCCYYKGVGS